MSDHVKVRGDKGVPQPPAPILMTTTNSIPSGSAKGTRSLCYCTIFRALLLVEENDAQYPADQEQNVVKTLNICENNLLCEDQW